MTLHSCFQPASLTPHTAPLHTYIYIYLTHSGMLDFWAKMPFSGDTQVCVCVCGGGGVSILHEYNRKLINCVLSYRLIHTFKKMSSLFSPSCSSFNIWNNRPSAHYYISLIVSGFTKNSPSWSVPAKNQFNLKRIFVILVIIFLKLFIFIFYLPANLPKHYTHLVWLTQ